MQTGFPFVNNLLIVHKSAQKRMLIQVFFYILKNQYIHQVEYKKGDLL
jgi:hypothetical protein